MAFWNPWRGCQRYSEGCRHCYIHKGDVKRNIDTSQIVKTKDFTKPIDQLKNGTYKIKSGIVYLCFSSDFFLAEADQWRDECWKMIKKRSDLTFLFLTKRIERFETCIPNDWNDGYENVVICCTVENQKTVEQRLPLFQKLPIKHKCITAQPLLEEIDLEAYLDGIELVVVGGESDSKARPLNYDWVLKIRKACLEHQVDFEFRQCGTHFIKDGTMYTLPVRELTKQARLCQINYHKQKNNLE